MKRSLRSRARIVAGLPALWREAGRLPRHGLAPDRLDLALPPPGEGPLTRIEQAVRRRTGFLRSGFLLLRSNAEGLRWRQQETWFGKRVDPDFAAKRG